MSLGYDTGYISSVLVTLGKDLGHTLSANEEELVTSITSGGALIGAIIAGLCADRFGRKLGVYIGCILFVLGAVLQAAAFSLAQMTVGRLVVGLGVGSAAMIIPLYIGEIAPAKHRGRMIACENCCVAGGQFIAYCIGAGFAEVSHGQSSHLPHLYQYADSWNRLALYGRYWRCSCHRPGMPYAKVSRIPSSTCRTREDLAV